MTLTTVLASAKSAARFVRRPDLKATPPAWLGGGAYLDVTTTTVISHRRWGTTTFVELAIPTEVFASEAGLVALALALGEVAEHAHVHLVLDPDRAPYAPPRQIAVLRTPDPDPASMTLVYRDARSSLEPLFRAPLEPKVVRELLAIRPPAPATWDHAHEPGTRMPLAVWAIRHAASPIACLRAAGEILSSPNPPPLVSLHVSLGGSAVLLLGGPPDPDLSSRLLGLTPSRPEAEVLVGRQAEAILGLMPLARSPMEARK